MTSLVLTENLRHEPRRRGWSWGSLPPSLQSRTPPPATWDFHITNLQTVVWKNSHHSCLINGISLSLSSSITVTSSHDIFLSLHDRHILYTLNVISTLSRHFPDHRRSLCPNWRRKFWTLIHKSCCWPQEDRRKTGRQSNSSPMACNAPGSHTLTHTRGILSYPLGTPLVNCHSKPVRQICNVTIPYLSKRWLKVADQRKDCRCFAAKCLNVSRSITAATVTGVRGECGSRENEICRSRENMICKSA